MYDVFMYSVSVSFSQGECLRGGSPPHRFRALVGVPRLSTASSSPPVIFCVCDEVPYLLIQIFFAFFLRSLR